MLLTYYVADGDGNFSCAACEAGWYTFGEFVQRIHRNCQVLYYANLCDGPCCAFALSLKVCFLTFSPKNVTASTSSCLSCEPGTYSSSKGSDLMGGNE